MAKDKIVSIRFTQTEFQSIEYEAQRKDLSVSDLIRDLCRSFMPAQCTVCLQEPGNDCKHFVAKD